MARRRALQSAAAATPQTQTGPTVRRGPIRPRVNAGAGWEPGTDREMWEESKEMFDVGRSAANDNMQQVLANQQGAHASRLREMMESAHFGAQHSSESVFDVLSYEDRMIHQQWYPGTQATPYVAAGTPMPSPSICFKNNNSETNTEMIGDNLNQVALGTGDYVIVAFCPSFTLLNGSGGQQRYEDTEKLSGVIFNQTDLTSEPGIELSWFDDVRYSRNMLEIYGSDCTGFATAGFVWAAEMEVKTLAPLANLVGSYYKGTVTVGQLGATGRISVQDLIEIATETGVHSSSQSLRSAVVNRNIVFSGSTATEEAHNITNMSQSFQQEAISYLILQRPVQNITTGDSSSFSLMMSVSGNCVFWPDARDSIANGLGHALLQAGSVHGNKREHNPQTLLPPITAGSFVHQAPAKSNRGFLDQLSRLVKFAWDNRDTIAGGISSAASFIGPLLMATSPQNSETLFVKFSYTRALQHLELATVYFQHDQSMQEVIFALKAQIQRNRSVLDGADWRGQRIVPESAFAVVEDPLDASIVSYSGSMQQKLTTPGSRRG